jgi:hypothetical protein
MNHSRSMWRCLFLLCFAQVAVAQDSIPTDAELRSAYCVPVLQWFIRENRSELANFMEEQKNAVTPEYRQILTKKIDELQQDVAVYESALNRLQSYLLPRIQHLDPTALMLASNRGNADRQQLSSMIDRCYERCGISLGVPLDDKKKECIVACQDTLKDVAARLQPCRNPSWLPF